MNTQIQKAEHRKYPRVHRIFSVEFQYLDENGQPLGDIFRGVTENVAKEGILIEIRVDKLKKPLEFIADKTKLKLLISIPPDFPPIPSIATVKWTKKISEPEYDTYFLGVHYDKIDYAHQVMIETYVNRFRKKHKVFFYFLLLFITFAIVFTYYLLVRR